MKKILTTFMDNPKENAVNNSEKKNEVHLVTDGHDKKLNPKQPFFKLSS